MTTSFESKSWKDGGTHKANDEMKTEKRMNKRIVLEPLSKLIILHIVLNYVIYLRSFGLFIDWKHRISTVCSFNSV